MEKPNVVLKKVKHFQGLDGYGLNAEVYINGVYCTFVIDEGNGGCLDYQHNFRLGSDNHNAMIKERIKLLEDYIATLPDIVSSLGGDEPFTYKQDLDSYINQLVDDMENAKEKAKFEKKKVKLFETAIVFGIPDSDKYQFMKFKNPINDYQTAEAKSYLQAKVKSIALTYCKNGIEILNTNLKPLGITY
jgi:hypothetical protein